METGVACHVSPSATSELSFPIPLGAAIRVTRTTQTNGVTWYFDSWRVTGVKPSCWVYGPSTITGDGTNRQFLELSILDHVLARKNASLDDYVEVENFLSGNPAWHVPSGRLQVSGLVGFRYLQMLDRALALMRANPDFNHESPLKQAWILSHGDLVAYFEPGADWYVPARQYWTLFEANKGAQWAEDLAWTAANLPTHSDECYSDCILDLVADGPAQYWLRYPAGIHVTEALSEAAERVGYAAQQACVQNPALAEDSFVRPQTAVRIRKNLVTVVNPGKERILRSLTEIDRKCKR